ncbi:hypothetical protein [Chamaesiphon minutus]|uniref:Uncharacterized protein n=1 Tax=Chamaesiphon minutus (strain ATCC 27169 / PCC 6605) TaxID=1173020 RepID=K9UES5_CHAP6|nr:hypothetical protein [Chamaesiphon minutus]AFY92926.1 hypothetical protein Cha6605_1805 [Chamaesiphon minutus PCC 6605]
MNIIKIGSLALLAIGSTATIVKSQEASALSQAENAKTIAMIKDAFGSVTLKNIAPPTQNIQIQFPATTPQTQPTTTTIAKGGSWSQLPIGAFTGVGSGGNESMVTLAQKIYPTTPEVQTAVQGALSNFKFLDKVPVKQLVTAFPQLANVAINTEQVGSWGACGAGAVPTFGSVAATSCGANPIPADVRAAIPIAQTGMHNIPYGDFANKLNIQNLPTTSFPLAADVSFAKILLMPSTSLTTANLMKVDHLETEVPGKNGQKITGINLISGSNRVPNSTCKEPHCDYTVLQNMVAGRSNPLNRNLAIQIHKPGQTKWIDGGVGSIGKTLWNFKEPPGVAPAFDSDQMKLVLERGNAKTGTVEQRLYLAFCTNIAFERNCSSKFIGPIALPLPQVSEKNKLALFPMKVEMPDITATPTTPTPTAPAAATLPTIIPTKQSNGATESNGEIAPTVAAAPATTDTSIAYQKLFGSHTIGSYSPLSNITNIS